MNYRLSGKVEKRHITGLLNFNGDEISGTLERVGVNTSERVSTVRGVKKGSLLEFTAGEGSYFIEPIEGDICDTNNIAGKYAGKYREGEKEKDVSITLIRR